MFDPSRAWPMGLTKDNLPRFLVAGLVILVLLHFLDEPVTRLVAGLPEAVRAPFWIITRPGNSDWILIPSAIIGLVGAALGYLVLGTPMKQRVLRIAAMSGFVFFGVAAPGLLANILKRAIGRARPVVFDEFGVLHFAPVNFDWQFQSFPSGDTTTMFALAVVVAFLWPRLFWPTLALAAAVGLARIMIGMHFPTDVFGGIVTGTIGAYAVRNFYASRGWLFERSGDGTYRFRKG